MTKSYLFEFPIKEVPMGPLFGASYNLQIDKYEKGVRRILEEVVLRDPNMGGISIEMAVKSYRKILGDLRVVQAFTEAFPSWEGDFTALCRLWYRMAELNGEAHDEGVMSMSIQTQLYAARDLLWEGKIGQAEELLSITEVTISEKIRNWDEDYDDSYDYDYFGPEDVDPLDG